MMKFGDVFVVFCGIYAIYNIVTTLERETCMERSFFNYFNLISSLLTFALSIFYFFFYKNPIKSKENKV